MKYPTDIVDGEGWNRIHQGHELDRAALEYDLRESGASRPDDAELCVEEVHMGYRPRVKWCANYGWPCDNEGEWHGHWYALNPGSYGKYTIVRWNRKPALSTS